MTKPKAIIKIEFDEDMEREYVLGLGADIMSKILTDFSYVTGVCYQVIEE